MSCVALSVCEIGPALCECLKASFKKSKILSETNSTENKTNQSIHDQPPPPSYFLIICVSDLRLNYHNAIPAHWKGLL